MKAKGLFITGTDTGVGKTWVTTRLIEHLRSNGIKAIGMKPIECGGWGDSTAILEASGGLETGLTLDEVNPVNFPEPLAPAAATISHRIDFENILARYDALADRFDRVIVEGAGGWLVPLDRERTMADLAVRLNLPVMVVAANRLGVLNHALLTVRSIEGVGLECQGIFLNDMGGVPDLSCESNRRVLRELLPDIDIFGMDIARIIPLP